MHEISDNLATSFSPRQIIESAARKTGANFDFLLQTAARESNFDPDAQARTSSAAGMFQFIEQTWLAMMARHGANHGHAELSAQIKTDDSGRYIVHDPAKREQVLALRFDLEIASVMAGELTSENAAQLRERIGRDPTTGELYAAHFLGASGAATLINLAQTNPDTNASNFFPEAAAANKPVFEKHGAPVSLSQLLETLTRERSLAEIPDQIEQTSSAGSEQPQDFKSAIMASRTALSPASILTPDLVELLASLQLPDRADDDH